MMRMSRRMVCGERSAVACVPLVVGAAVCRWLAASLLFCMPLTAQQRMPVRPLGPVTAVTGGGVLGSVSAVRALPGGSVLVNDIIRRQLLLLGQDLMLRKVVADTTAATSLAYGSAICGLIAFAGDSSLFIDPRSLSMLVITASGEIGRVMAIPSPRDAYSMIGGPFGTPGFDTRGRLVFRGLPPIGSEEEEHLRDSSRTLPFADKAPLYRLDFATRRRDTLTSVVIPRQSVATHYDRNNRMIGATVLTNPLTPVDDWAVLADGRVVVVRGADYRAEWLATDDSWHNTPRVPFGWERIDDDGKQRVLDSVRTQADSARESLKRRIEEDPASARTANWTNQGVAATSYTSYPSGRSGPPKVEWFVPVTTFIDPRRMPDYRPAFRMGAAKADGSGNLWVRTTTPSATGAIYDVLSPDGQLIDRVRVPYGRVVAGFGPGVVYLGVLDEQGARLERANLR